MIATAAKTRRQGSRLRIAVPRAANETIGSRQSICENKIRVSILIRVDPSIDLRPFLDTTRLYDDLANSSLDLILEGHESVQSIGNIVAQHLMRKTVLYGTTTPESEPEADPDPDPVDLRDYLPPILILTSSLLFALCVWPSENGSLLVADDMLVGDMLIWQDCNSKHEFVTTPGILTIYCVLGSVKILMPDQYSGC